MPLNQHNHISPAGLVVRTAVIVCSFVSPLTYKDELVRFRDVTFALTKIIPTSRSFIPKRVYPLIGIDPLCSLVASPSLNLADTVQNCRKPDPGLGQYASLIYVGAPFNVRLEASELSGYSRMESDLRPDHHKSFLLFQRVKLDRPWVVKFECILRNRARFFDTR